MSLDIRDVVLEPFFIKVDEYSIDVYLSKVREEGAKKGETVEISKGSFVSLDYALKYVVAEKTRLELEKENDFITIDQYIKQISAVYVLINNLRDKLINASYLKNLLQSEN